MATEFVIIRIQKPNVPDGYVCYWTFDAGLRLTDTVENGRLYTNKEADHIISVEKKYALDKIKVTIDL